MFSSNNILPLSYLISSNCLYETITKIVQFHLTLISNLKVGFKENNF